MCDEAWRSVVRIRQEFKTCATHEHFWLKKLVSAAFIF